MKVPALPRWIGGSCLALFVLAAHTMSAAQVEPFVGTCRAAQPDRGVVVTLTISKASTLVIPGGRRDGSIQPLNLTVRNLLAKGRVATFTVDLPQNEGTLDFEFQTADGMGTLRALRLEGQPLVGDDSPTWRLDRRK